jgi:UDPglucose 6-dehydrogenase
LKIQSGRLSFTASLQEGVVAAEAIFLALPTPPQADGSADLSAILAVASQLGELMPNHYCVIIDKSTVPVGTAERVRLAIAKTATSEFDVVSNPEFLREGHAVMDFLEPERLVIGVTSPQAEERMRAVYETFITDDRLLYVTDPATAELIKYACNTFLVTKISFMNEIAQLCERMNANVDMVRMAMGADSRIGHKFLSPGIGAGGSCFPKDVRALRHMAEEQGYDFKLLNAAIAVNDQQQHVLSTKIKLHFNGEITGKTFALWGLAFKPNTDDIREAPALVLIDELLAAGAIVVAYDPQAGNGVRKLYANTPNLRISDDKYLALNAADALLIATEWSEFSAADLMAVKAKLATPIIFDGRNIFQPTDMEEAGFTYYSVGRRAVIQ